MHHTTAFGLGFDEVDALTGPRIGRPKSATYRTADVVGLDTLAHVVKTMQDTLPNDPWHGYFKTPEWLAALIGKGALGQKTTLRHFPQARQGQSRCWMSPRRITGLRQASSPTKLRPS